MKQSKLLTFPALAASLYVASANAAFVPLPSGIAILEDDNIEYVLTQSTLDINNDGVVDNLDYELKTSGALVAGDRLRAVVTFQGVLDSTSTTTQPLGSPGLELTGVSEIEIVSISAAGIVFKPSAAFEATYGAGAMAALFSQSPGDFTTACNITSIAACETQATNGTHWLTAGFGDVDDFWVATGNVGTAPIEVVANEFAVTKLGLANYALSILDNNTGYMFNEQTISALIPVAAGGDHMTDLLGSGDILGGRGLANGFFARSDFDFQLDVVPVPEPSTLAIFGIGLLATGAAARRRKS